MAGIDQIMNNQLKKNRSITLLIFAMTIIPFCVAWLLKENPQILSSRTNKGQLITPVIVTERSDLQGFDRFSMENISELKGHWLIVNVIHDKQCNEICLDALHKTRQIRLMLNKDLTRTRRVVLLMKDVEPKIAASWWQDDIRLLRVMPKQNLIAKLQNLRKGDIPTGMLLLMDPMGNLMMQYEPGFDPYDVMKDLKKVLRISQIG